MPMRYADEPDVLAHLRIEDSDTDAIEQVVRLENGLAEMFDGKVGRSFGETVPPVTREVRGLSCEVLVIGEGIRSITGIEVDGAWNGTAWTDGVTLGTDAWRVWAHAPDGVIYAIERLGGPYWQHTVRITGVWADQPDGSVPADVREAMTTLTVKEYRRRTSSPSEQIGPDGLMIPAPSGWNDPTVQATIEHHIVTRLLV